MTGQIHVARVKETVYMQVIGHGSMVNSLTFKEFSDKMIEDGVKKFVIDLDRCDGMDSSFMGTILWIALSTQEEGGNGVVILNANEHNYKLLSLLGLTKIVHVKEGKTEVPVVRTENLRVDSEDPQKRVKFILEVHQNLAKITPENEQRFGPFIRSLSKEVFGS